MYIGKRIKELREQKGMKLIELSEKSGVQLATLSRIEHLKMTGTLECHVQVAKALGINLTELYTDIVTEEEKAQMKTPKTISDIFVHNDKCSYDILTSNIFRKKMMPILLKIEPGGKTNKEQGKFGTEKFVYVIDGKIEIRVGKETYPLSKNNTLYFDASLEHTMVNTGAKTARVICVVTPVVL